MSHLYTGGGINDDEQKELRATLLRGRTCDVCGGVNMFTCVFVVIRPFTRAYYGLLCNPAGSVSHDFMESDAGSSLCAEIIAVAAQAA